MDPQSMRAIRAADGAQDILSEKQVQDYLTLLSSKDAAFLKSDAFTEKTRQVLAVSGPSRTLEGTVLINALQDCFSGDMAHLQSAFREEFANGDALKHVLTAFGGSSACATGVSVDDFPRFVRFCVAYRIHCYFETPCVLHGSESAFSKPKGVAEAISPTVIFVLGGPGSGKGTQCQRLSQTFGMHHLSVGDLLREERKRAGSQYGSMIESLVSAGQLVPGDLTVKLLKQTMEKRGWNGGSFLIDGFPRSLDNLENWDRIMGGDVSVKMAVFFDCSDACLKARLLERGKTSGRTDDTPEIIDKRLDTFQRESLPVAAKLESRSLLRRIAAEADAGEVWHSVKGLFAPTVVFVVGGPGVGKGKLCSLISDTFDYKHLSIRDILQDEQRRPGSQHSSSIDQYMKEGKLLPAEVIVKLIVDAMKHHGWEGCKYLINGFPRSLENLVAWNAAAGDHVLLKFALYLECSEGVLEARLLERGKVTGRTEDNTESIRKSFLKFRVESMPVIEQIAADGLLKKIDAEKSVEATWEQVQRVFGPTVVFVLGGPGAGKGTQCKNISEMFGYTHLSAGDLLREERTRAGSKYGDLIQSHIKEGKLVPADVTVNLIESAMMKHGWEGGRFLIDGFPRSFDNLDSWKRIIGGRVSVKFALYLDCSEAVMQARLLERGKTSGRVDDNLESIKLRFKTFQEESKPVVERFASDGLLRRADATQSVERVLADVTKFFQPSVVFVLGGPGVGKGTMSQRIATAFNFHELSAVELLKEEQRRPGSTVADIVDRHMREGSLVPSRLMVDLLQKAMERVGWDGGRFLITNFPMSVDNMDTFEESLGSKVWVRLALSLEASQQAQRARLLERSKSSSRVDDNSDSIMKRLKTFEAESPAILERFRQDWSLRQIDAEQDIESVWESTSEVMNQELDAHVLNHAIVLVKPHAGKQEIDRFVQSCLTANKITVLKKGTVSAKEVADRGLFDQQYFQIWRYASEDPSVLQLSSSAQALFRESLGIAWLDAVSSREVVSAVAALERLGAQNNKELADLWEKADQTKLGSCLTVARLVGKNNTAVVVVNGFAPHWRDSFAQQDQSMSWFAVEFSPAKLTWKNFRARVLGSTDPSKAPEESIRGQLFKHWKEMGLTEQPTKLNNCVHASAGPLEGLRESLLWSGGSLEEKPLARFLSASGIGSDTVKPWLQNPEVFGWKVGVENHSGPIFACTERCDVREFRDSAILHLRGRGVLPDATLRVVARASGKREAQTNFDELMTVRPGGVKTDKMTILHFNDVYNVEPRAKEPVGGIARFVTRMRQLQAESVSRGEPEAVILFSGDAFNPSLTSTTTMGKHMIPALNAIGIHTACYGNHDFDFGVDNLVEMAGENNFPWLLSNVVDKTTRRPLAEGTISRIMDFHGRKVGLIGLVEKEWLVTLATLEPEDVIFEDPCPCARRLAKQLKEEQGVEIVIALTHMRVPNDELLAHEVPEVDVILAGHDHHYEVKPVGPHGTYVLKSGTDFRDITVLTLDFSKPSGKKCFSVVHSSHEEIVASIPEEPQMKVFVDECMAKLGSAMDKILCDSAVDLDCRFSSIRTQETNIGNFVADVMRYGLNADMAMINSGTLRADCVMDQGPLKMRDLVNLLPMLDEVCLLQMSGSQVLSALENSVSQYPRLEGRFAQVSGVAFSFDAAKPGGERIVAGTVKIGGHQLEPTKNYKLVTKDYLRQGKDGYDVFKDAICLADGEQAGILPTMIRECFNEICTLNGETETAPASAIDRASKLLNDGFVVRVGDGPEPLKRFAISPKVEGRVICLNPK
eukprot:TRINITY_DN68624_c0_g1_i1.p1 TRINITY_DN68624_c0_g1~~TRINITY_DN68624_c0_g1_i1.p1  ORF type:complete len:1791 (+),score=282.65 TRINITY_DN68624_c0_g1_i1:195-5567(+)